MRPPFFMPTQVMPQMPVAPRFPMYAPYMMRMPMPTPPMPPIQPQFVAPVAEAVTAAAATPRLEGLLAGANSLFENAQKFTPYIQQATPMLKNLPALWRMYRGFKNSPDPLESSTIIAPVEPSARPRRKRPPEQIPRTAKPSLPMIFQPPFH